MSLTVNTNLFPQNNWNNNQAKLSTAANATVASVPVDAAVDTVNVSSVALDTYTSTITSTVTSLQSSVDNMASILNRIRDKGFTQQSAVLLRTQFTEQPHIAMLAQANLSPQSVSALLR
ncbi:MAG TPA: flagellin [Methylobacter sp.]|jgi:flagellin-like hook-associated protein FlgL